MIQNTSSILNEKYTEKIKKDAESSDSKNIINNSEPKKSLFDKRDVLESTDMFKQTYEVFSTRYNQVPSKKIVEQTDLEDDEEEKSAIFSKEENLMKVSSKINMDKSSKHTEENKNEILEEEDFGKDILSFYFKGLDIFFIDDHGDNSYPVICCSLKDTNYNRENLKEGSFQSQAFLDASFDYYNIKTCYWEPFIEGMEIEFQYDKQLSNSVIQIKGKDSLNLNISPDFVAITTFLKASWEKANKELLAKPSVQEEIPKDLFSEEVKEAYSEEIISEGRETLSEFIENQNAVESATPYKIENYTGNIIFVETLFDKKKKGKYILKDCSSAKIAISYEKQTFKNYEIERSKMNDNVQILFEGMHNPIEKISLNKFSSGMHKLTDIEEISDFIFYETKVIKTSKVLTLRTQNLLINSTQFSYDIVIK